MTHYGVFSLALLVAALFAAALHKTRLAPKLRRRRGDLIQGAGGPPMKKNPSLQGQTPCTTPDCDTVLQATFRDKV